METRDRFWDRLIRTRAVARLVAELSIVFGGLAVLVVRGGDWQTVTLIGFALTSLSNRNPEATWSAVIVEWLQTRDRGVSSGARDRDLRAS